MAPTAVRYDTITAYILVPRPVVVDDIIRVRISRVPMQEMNFIVRESLNEPNIACKMITYMTHWYHYILYDGEKTSGRGKLMTIYISHLYSCATQLPSKESGIVEQGINAWHERDGHHERVTTKYSYYFLVHHDDTARVTMQQPELPTIAHATNETPQPMDTSRRYLERRDRKMLPLTK